MKYRQVITIISLLTFLVCGLVSQNSLADISDQPGAVSRYKKGAEAAKQFDYSKAVEEYTGAIQIDPNYTDAFSSRGVAYAKLMKFGEAVADFSRVIDLSPENPEPYHNRGMVLSQLRDYDRAIADFDKAISLKNRDAFVLSKAQTLEAAGRADEAVAAYKTFINHPDLKLTQFVELANGRILDLTGGSIETEPLKVDDSVRMVYSVYRFEGPAIDDNTFLAIPRKIWRVGRTYMRAEEELNPLIGYRSLMIVNEPDYWVINRDTYSGRHGVDQGPTFNTVAPVLSKFAAIYSDSLLKFELCREKTFFEERNARKVAERTIDGVPCDLYELFFGDVSLSLYLRKDNTQPWKVTLAQEGNPVLIVRYDEYQSDLKPDLSLFRPPAGTTISEMESPETE